MTKEKSIKHIAIIMDGNGRWAQERAHRRLWGHIRGSQVVTKIVEAADNLNVSALTLYAFSTENFSRPLEEVTGLFNILKKFIKKERKNVLKNNLVFRVIGDINSLPEETQKLVRDLTEDSKHNSGMILNFAFGYGGRNELITSMNKFIESNPGKKINEEHFVDNLYTHDCSEVDLMIRTGGDQRISNFLLWQLAYAELFFTDTKWPDFRVEEFEDIFFKVSKRDRRFGAIAAEDSLKSTKNRAAENKLKLNK